MRSFNSEIRSNQVGAQFQTRLEEQQDVFLTIVAPKSQMIVDVYDSAGRRASTEDVYNMDSPGGWILVRSKKNGEPVLARWYFSKDSGVYIQFRPNGNTSLADLVIFDSYAALGVPVGVPFENFYTASFAQIQALTKNNIPWNYVTPDPGFSEDSIVMIQTIREKLGYVAYFEDAAYNEEGKPVSIQSGQPRYVPQNMRRAITLSSNGFVKWICDGLVEPLAGSYLRLSPLVQKTVKNNPSGSQGIFESRFNSNLSLDWTRNLAAAVLSVNSNKTVLYKDSGVDVTIEPFAARWTQNGVRSEIGYIKNTGYKIQYLRPLLYVLAAVNPQYFYLVAIRQTGKGPDGNEVKVFNDAAAIFPYFDAEGRFRAQVFYDGSEYSLQQFCDAFDSARPGDCFAHLVRIKASSKFYPQEPSKDKNDD